MSRKKTEKKNTTKNNSEKDILEKNKTEEVISNTIINESQPEEVISNTIINENEPKEVISNTIINESQPEEVISNTIINENQPEEVNTENIIKKLINENNILETENILPDEICIDDKIIDDYFIGEIDALYEDNISIVDKSYILNDKELNNILYNNEITVKKTYNLEDLKNIFTKFKSAIIIIQILNDEIKFVEKKGYESRNQSVIDLLIKTNTYKKLPNCQFAFFTDDLIKNNLEQFPYLLTFCKKYNHNTTLFPNFNFNHWLEADIGNYEDIYDNFINKQISWNDKKDIVFWSGANTNPIRKKMFDSSKKYPNFNLNILNKNDKRIPINDIINYKYLINMNGYSYSGRLNYLFLSGSCVIILKNENKENNYEEFYYKYFIPNEDYLEIIYNDNENTDDIINRINKSISINNCEEIAKKSYEKAKKIFQINNVYEYIYNIVNELSLINKTENYLKKSICFSSSNIFLNKRVSINNNSFNFNFTGKDFEINIKDIKDTNNTNIINLKVTSNHTKIYFNEDLLFDKYTPLIINEKKNQHYEFLIDKDTLNIIINNKFKLINCQLPIEYQINDVDIRTESDAWWLL